MALVLILKAFNTMMNSNISLIISELYFNILCSWLAGLITDLEKITVISVTLSPSVNWITAFLSTNLFSDSYESWERSVLYYCSCPFNGFGSFLNFKETIVPNQRVQKLSHKPWDSLLLQHVIWHKVKEHSSRGKVCREMFEKKKELLMDIYYGICFPLYPCQRYRCLYNACVLTIVWKEIWLSLAWDPVNGDRTRTTTLSFLLYIFFLSIKPTTPLNQTLERRHLCGKPPAMHHSSHFSL